MSVNWLDLSNPPHLPALYAHAAAKRKITGMRLGAKFAPEIEGLDEQTLNTWLNAGEIGQIVDVLDDEDGEHIEVFLE